MQTLLEAASAGGARDVWLAARSVILSPEDDVSTATLIDALHAVQRWALLKRGSSEERTLSFVAECAFRMAVMDACSDRNVPGALPFAPVSVPEARELIRRAEHAWNEAEFENWNAIAYAVCFSPASQVTIDEPFLAKCSEFQFECAQRAELRRFLCKHSTLAGGSHRHADAADCWAARCMRHASDEVFELAMEARCWGLLTPAAERKGAGAPSAKLAAWEPDRARETQAGAIHFIFLFDYALRQLTGVCFLNLFFTSDYMSDAALARIESLKTDRLRAPPPLVVHSLREWYVVYRGEGQSIGRIVSHSTARDAVLGWMEYVMDERKGKLFVGKTLNSLYDDITTTQQETEGPLVAETFAL